MSKLKIYKVRPQSIETGNDYMERFVFAVSLGDVETLYPDPDSVQSVEKDIVYTEAARQHIAIGDV
jgi:hypothetical protein